MNNMEYEKLMDEILDDEIDFSNKSEEFIKLFFNREVAEKEILKRDGKDLQQQFREAIKKNPMLLDNMNKSLDGRTKKEIEEEKRDIEVKNVTKEIAKEENLTREDEEEIEEEAKKEKDLTRSEIKALAIKVIYEYTLDEYHKLREDLYTGYNGQVKTGNLTNGDKMDTKLIMYQRYLRNLDMQYRQCSGYLITQADDSLKQKENRYFYNEQLNEKQVYDKAEKNLSRVHELNEQLDSIAEEIARISENAALMTPEKFESSMEELKKDYKEKTLELRALDPNMVELSRQINEKEENDLAEQRMVGQGYEDLKYKKGIIDNKNTSLDNYTDGQEEKIGENIKVETADVNQNLISSVEEQKKLADEAFAKFEQTENIEDYNIAISHLAVAEQMAGYGSDVIENELNFDDNQIEDENADKNEDDKDKDKKDDMGLNRTNDDKISILKASYNERSRNLSDKINEMNANEKDRDGSELVRKMN